MAIVTTIVENSEISENIIQIDDTNKYYVEIISDPNSIFINVQNDIKNTVEINTSISNEVIILKKG